MKWSEIHSVMSNSLQPHELSSPWTSPGHNTGVGSLPLLQGIFPTQESYPALHIAGIFFTSRTIKEALNFDIFKIWYFLEKEG